VLVHCYAPAARVIRHVYLHEARRLRLDLIEDPADDSA
jgi:chorismate mutase